MNVVVIVMFLIVINNIMELRTFFMYFGFFSYYQEDIFYRRYCLEEEFLQLFVESILIVFFDSDISYDEDDGYEFSLFYFKFEQFVYKEFMGSKISLLCFFFSVGKDDNGFYFFDVGDGGFLVCV